MKSARSSPGLKVGTVTTEWLRGLACSEQVALFAETFGESVDITPESIARAAEAGLDLEWAAEHLLTATAWAAYDQATATAWAAYEQAKATAVAAYQQAKAPAWAAYQQAKATAVIQILFPDHRSDT